MTTGAHLGVIQDSVMVVVVVGDILEVEEVATMEEIMTEAKKTVATNLRAMEVAGEGSSYGGRGKDSYSSLGSSSSSYGRKYGQGYSIVVEFTVTDEERILDPSTRMLAQHKK